MSNTEHVAGRSWSWSRGEKMLQTRDSPQTADSCVVELQVILCEIKTLCGFLQAQ